VNEAKDSILQDSTNYQGLKLFFLKLLQIACLTYR